MGDENVITYCAVIRTLGRAGAKYQALLDSLVGQTLQPSRILVYLAEGYDEPRETVGVERIVRCPKGMIAQRALPFDEVDTDYILFLDDDIAIAPDGVERLARAMLGAEADCAFADFYALHRLSAGQKFRLWLEKGDRQTSSRRWAYRECRSSATAYSGAPEPVMPSQTGCGGAILCSKAAYDAIDFAEELWADAFSYPLGDDHLFLYKMYVRGFKVVAQFDSGFTHLDASADRRLDYAAERDRLAVLHCVWYRCHYHRQPAAKRVADAFFYGVVETKQVLLRLALAVRRLSTRPLSVYFSGMRLARRIINSDEFSRLPRF
ncbi:MAG: glycosyltransferase [Candidatus Limisoma sp.]